MNIAHPVASTIEAIDFSYYAQDDVHRLSVKRITNPTALDALLQPTPGGLHDLALGAFLDNPCATCGLNAPSCPGHCGHIDLPAPVYHCTYIDQMFKYLRAQCRYCYRLKMSRVQVSDYWARLQLLRHGLLEASHQVADIQSSTVGTQTVEADDSDEDEATQDQNRIVEMRRAFVAKSLQDAGVDPKQPVYLGDQTEAVAEERKHLLNVFHRDITSVPKCRNCQAYSPKYRKNKASSVFRKALSTKELAQNAQVGIKGGEHPVKLLNKKLAKKAQREKRLREGAMDIDEGIADMDSQEEDEIRVLDSAMDLDEPEDISSEEGEDITQNASDSLVAGEASGATKKKKRSEEEPAKQQFVNAGEVYALISHLFDHESELFAQIYGGASVTSEPRTPSADIFFIKSLVVPPNKYRKEQKSGVDEVAESPDNASYKTILNACGELAEIQRQLDPKRQSSSIGRVQSYDDLQTSWVRMQDAVNTLIDKEKNPATGAAALRIPNGIKQKLEKKEGLFRMNIMGKRVNFAARSVISPDPNIESNEIGVPPVFAKKLTYPEPVTAHSFEELKQAVLNGPDIWPGAAAVEYENGQVINLRHKNVEERQAIANLLLAPSSTAMTGNRNKKVHRHLNNGDIVIMNRQPTLHKPSMMCHRARVLPGEKTIRMHYANCKTYNADFDGDEMNMHFPQNEIARAEALQIADNDHQYLSATAGEPLRGLIQDHISVSVALTSLDCFFTRDEYHEILYASLRPEAGHTSSDRIRLLEPTIWKPKPLWTGKQVISTLLANIQPTTHAPLELTSGCSVNSRLWGNDSEEGQVRVRDGLLLTGIVDKKSIGPSKGGLIHTIYETYGHTSAGKFLSILGRLLTRFLSAKAFSCGVEDLVLTAEGEMARKSELKKADTIGLEVAAKFVSLDNKKLRASNPELLKRLEEAMRDSSKQAQLDVTVNGASGKLTSSITRLCLPNRLIKQFPKNQMQVMTGSGAKGSMVNANLISCNLGQQVLEGARVPLMVSGKSLPAFKPFDSSIRAGGYVTDRFLTGVRPQEYYFHAMAGREGLIDTAVKTSRSGYLQRCLIKGLEGLRADYDGSVRDADGTMVQTLYGEDGLDITKQAALMSFEHMTNNFVSTFMSLNMREEASILDNNDLIDRQKAILKDVKRESPQVEDPLVSRYPPATNPYSTSEKFWRSAREYFELNKERLKAMETPITRKTFEKVMAMKYLKSVVEAGEAVGVVAGQSLGEPSTQMTLNTFHLAGHSAKNVTLGIPRLREILMTASQKIKTPTMTLYHHPELSEEQAKTFAKSISSLSLTEVLDSTSVTERIGQGRFGETRTYDIDLHFWPAKEYKEEYVITIEDVADTIEKKFLPELQKGYKAELKKRGDEKLLKSADSQPEIGKASSVRQNEDAVPDADNEGGDSDDDDAGDDDATDAKKRKQQDEGQTYDDPDSDEDGDLISEAEAEEDEDSPRGPEDEGYNSGSQPSDGDEADAGKSKKAAAAAIAQERESRVLSKFANVSQFKFDRNGSHCHIILEFPGEAPKLFLTRLIEVAAKKALVHHVDGIKSAAFVVDEKTRATEIITEGANLVAMREYQHIIQGKRMFTNDIAAMLRLYGVEAARETIIRELRAVFASHGIDVDQRHLTLVADYMTRKGGFSPFNRLGMQDKTSPFMKMSYETTFGVLRDAVFDGDRDRLDTPSGRITVGKIGRMGTGMCDVLMPIA